MELDTGGYAFLTELKLIMIINMEILKLKAYGYYHNNLCTVNIMPDCTQTVHSHCSRSR